MERFERKYLLTLVQYYQLRHTLLPYLKVDAHMNTHDGRYLVRSLYFDNHHLDAYHDKATGEHSRVKCRLRCYSTEYNPFQIVSVELKCRRGALVQKYSEKVKALDCQEFLQTGHWSRQTPVLEEFERRMYQNALQPKTIVQYEREAYFYTGDIRLTFDHQIQGVGASVLFSNEQQYFRDLCRHAVVLEIKHHQPLPQFFIAVIQQYSLKQVPYSKYGRSVEICYPALNLAPQYN